MNDLVKVDKDVYSALKNSLYVGASDASIEMVLSYCRAAQLDPMQKPVHIVPMWDGKTGSMRDVVMAGIGLYRINASRSGEFAGVSEPIFGDDVQAELNGVKFTHPAWCKVTVSRRLKTGEIAEFTAVERWMENYAMKGGKEKSVAPNAMWQKRPYGQIAKCAEAQALRKAFPELGAMPIAEEMEGKSIDLNVDFEMQNRQAIILSAYTIEQVDANSKSWVGMDADTLISKISTKYTVTDEIAKAIRAATKPVAATVKATGNEDFLNSYDATEGQTQ